MKPVPVKIFRKPSNSSFTLVEVVFGIGILASAICAILAAYTSGSVLINTSKNTNIATNAALGLMEEIRTSSFASIYDYNGDNFIINAIPASRGVVYVDDTNPELLQVTISVSWLQGNRIIGGDLNLNGVIDPGEQGTGGIIDSPVQLVTQIANR